MVNLVDNTREAIFNAVNSYLDSTRITLDLPRHSREMEIRYGAGKAGDVDVSSLEESLWPEYLEYLGQYTKFPELTIEVQDWEEFDEGVEESSHELIDD